MKKKKMLEEWEEKHKKGDDEKVGTIKIKNKTKKLKKKKLK
jgi:hypothetical protein